MANNESERSWVPDYLPKFDERDIAVSITDRELSDRVSEFIRVTEIDPLVLAKRSITLGLVLNPPPEKNKRYSIIEQTKDGTEEPLSLDLENKVIMYKRFGPITLFRSKNGIYFEIEFGNYEERMKAKLPPLIADELMRIANANQTTLNEVYDGMIRLGLRVCKGQITGSKKYLIQDDDGGRQELNNLWDS